MSQTKHTRPAKRQFGQFMTPQLLAERLIAQVQVTPSTRVLEPSFGDGSFILPLIEAFLPLYRGSIAERLDAVLTRNIFGVEIDPLLHQRCLEKIRQRWGYLPASHNLVCADFFRHDFYSTGREEEVFQESLFGAPLTFDLIVGNPPFGGTIDLTLQDGLDRRYGVRNGEKIKKESYSFFLVKCLDLLKTDGRLLFICSDTFTTIPTMRGLRKLLMETCSVTLQALETFSEETAYPMVLLDLVRSGRADAVSVNGQQIRRSAMSLTGNFSWAITDEVSRFFAGPTLGEYVVCSSGMTIGRNDLFVREISDGAITEPYDFEFFEDPITVAKELQRARLHILSAQALAAIRRQEQAGATRRNLRPIARAVPEQIRLPHPHYCYYNKATSDIIYSPPTHAIFWKDEGDAVLTFKKNGNWYLHGVGGKPYFGQSGLTWQLISSRLNTRYLPEGYILDSGAPCAFLRPGIEPSELFFILGWTSTALCTRLLKTVINHTKNIQSKDLERLPYPIWVSQPDKERAIALVRALVEKAMAGTPIQHSNPEMQRLDHLYVFREEPAREILAAPQPSGQQQQLVLWSE